MTGLLPDPVRDHYVVIDGRRFPPKQVLGVVTGLSRSEFTSHQALRVLRNLGFGAGRRSVTAVPETRRPASLTTPPAERSPPALRRRPTAEALAPYVGEWVAIWETEVLVGAPSAGEVVGWLNEHRLRADSMFRVPRDRLEASGAAPL